MILVPMLPNTLNILVVDDDEGDRKQMRRVLNRAGVLGSCIEAVNVKDALAACEELVFDCAIIDYRLPGEDGLKAISTLHERYPHMAIVMATGQGDELVATEAMKRGASDYFPKSSIEPQLMRRVIESAIQKATLSRKLSEQQQELENFARVLVHDLKSPLRSVALMSGLMEVSLEAGNTAEILDMCNAIAKTAVRMSQLIDDLYEYTKAEQRVPFESVPMEHVLTSSLVNLRPTIEQRKAHVTHSELPVVCGSPAQLIQLMQNLIGNGIKYCEDEIPLIHIAAKTHDAGAWLFSVKDNGIGIPKKYQQRIFEPFKRACDEVRYEGTGLGLATCKKILERHNGRIWCESKEGEGTTFFFTLSGNAARV